MINGDFMKKFAITFLSIMLSIAAFGVTYSAAQTIYYGKEVLLNAFDVYNNGTEEEWQEFFEDYLAVAGGPNSTPLSDEECEKFRKTENYFFSVSYSDVEQTKSESYYTDDFYFYFVLNNGSEYTFHCNAYDRTVYTIKEILIYSGINNAEDIVYISLRDKANMGIEITEYSLIPYSIGWNNVNGKKYYVKKDGTLAEKSTTINGIRYKFSSDGVCQGKYTGWTKSANGRRYYKNGVMLKERWIRTKSGRKYYAGEDGYMRTGWARVDGKTCFFDEKGVWDGKKYYKGYKPVSMKYFLMDFDFPDDIEYEYCINYKKYYDFEGIDVVREILEAEKDKKFIYDNSSDDETELNEGIYHGGKQIIIRCATDTKAADKTPHIIFTKDKDGNSYFYCSQYGFGCKLSDSEAYDKIAELI